MALTSPDMSSMQSDATWNSLKQAIAKTSGFQRWRIEKNVTGQLQEVTLDALVSRYLRETLETLAY